MIQLCVLAVIALDAVYAQAQTVEKSASDAIRLDKIVDARVRNRDARESLQQTVPAGELPSNEIKRQLNELDADIRAPAETFGYLAIGDIDRELFNVSVESTKFDWQAKLMLVLEPLLDEL
jgi:nucleotide-binding universal stress UspA family protein